MTTEPRLDDRLVHKLLLEADRALEAWPPENHPDAEALALFAAGALEGNERTALIRHLGNCVECRHVTSTILSLPEMASAGGRSPFRVLTGRSWIVWGPLAAAASILLMVGVLVQLQGRWVARGRAEGQTFAQANQLLQTGQFDQAQVVVADAARRGIESGRLRGIEAEAIRGIPNVLALAVAGRLSDFGFEIGGVTAREAPLKGTNDRARRAYELLARSPSDDVVIGLNRGHALLSLGQYREALTEFEAIAARHPREPLAPLGTGLAWFALADYPAAETAFRASLQVDPDNTAARMNLAMSLEEQGKYDEALTTWEQLLTRSLPDSDRQAILRQVEELRQNRAR